MDDVHIRATQLDEISDEIKALLDNLEKSNRREQDLDELEDKFRAYENTLQALQIELKSLSPADKKTWKRKYKIYKKKVKEFKNDYEWKKSNNARSALLDDHKDVGKPDLNTSDGMMQHGRAVMQEGKEALGRVLGVVASTQEIGKATLVKLDEQTKQLEKIFEDLKSIESTLERSTRVMKRIGRKMATDKYLWVIIFLVIFAIIFLIVWTSVRGGSTNAPSIKLPGV